MVQDGEQRVRGRLRFRLLLASEPLNLSDERVAVLVGAVVRVVVVVDMLDEVTAARAPLILARLSVGDARCRGVIAVVVARLAAASMRLIGIPPVDVLVRRQSLALALG
eukprot:8267974-Heterocapsa_arctica.AAC.1